MKLYELIKKNPVLNKDYFFKWYCRSDNETVTHTNEAEENYYQNHLLVFEHLKTLKPYTPKEDSNSLFSNPPLKIVIDFTSAEENDGWAYYNVSGFDEIEKMYYAIEFVPWSEWLDMEIDEDTLSALKEDEIIVHCLWEMTWCGYEEEDIQSKLDSLKDKKADIENGNVQDFIEFEL